MDKGLRKPTVSAIPSVAAPASAAASKICWMSSSEVLVPSMSMKLDGCSAFSAVLDGVGGFLEGLLLCLLEPVFEVKLVERGFQGDLLHAGF